MKNALQLIFIVIGLTSCKAQDINGIWMSYNNYVIDKESMTTSGNEGFIIDFDNKTFSAIFIDSIIPTKIDFKNSKLSFNDDSLSIDFHVFGKDSIEIDFEQNMMHVFRPLKLNHKLSVNKSQISKFLTKNNFDKTNDGIDFIFSDKVFFRDELFEKPKKRNTIINKTWNDEGYWYIKEIQQNFFLIFTIDQISNQNIYQIISMDNCKMQLQLLQEDEFRNSKLTELKICL
ncbi:hypothetical protein ACFQ0I_14910 [Mariniflexile aquimaris]|uniref:Lipocalin-like protein n=1 Tax=Mariniflexile aquimaris TaxID=881009 RepID=A0ABW3BWS4_9FLAO